MKYKVGDKVRVRKDLKVDKVYKGYVFFVPEMKKYLGKTVTISGFAGNYGYFIEEDDEEWNWTDEMFEGIENITILVEGNKVIAKRGNAVGIAKCSPEDEFDIFTGARLAIDRLEEECNPYCWLKDDVRYYVPDVTDRELYNSFIYRDDFIDKKMKERGLAFKTKKEAISCAKKMLEVIK